MVGRFGPQTNPNPTNTNTPPHLSRRRLEKDYVKTTRKKLGCDPDAELDIPAPLFAIENMSFDKEEGHAMSTSAPRPPRSVSFSSGITECPHCKHKLGGVDEKSPSAPLLCSDNEDDEESGRKSQTSFPSYQELREVLLARESRSLSFGIVWEFFEQELYVTKIEMNGPAFSAGLKVGDEIITINGDSVQESNEALINQLLHVDALTLKIVFRPRTVVVRNMEIIVHKTDWIGFKLQKRCDGVFINNVIPQSPAQDAHLKVGDELVKISGISIEEWDLKRTLEFLKNYPNDSDIRLGIRQIFPTRQPVGMKSNAISHQSSGSYINDDIFIGQESLSSESGASTLQKRPTLV